jgi:ABC-2 type transport system ATP-binding protein
VVADGSAAQIKNLASGRVVSATLRGVNRSQLLGLPGVREVEMRGDRVLVHASDSDAVARHLLTHTDAVDLEITTHNLEDAFIALTGAGHTSPGRPQSEERSEAKMTMTYGAGA